MAKKAEKEIISQYAKQDIDQKLKEGRIMVAHTKKEEVAFQVGGGGKGKKGKKAKV